MRESEGDPPNRLAQRPSVFLLDGPTHGLDLGARADLHRELARCAQERAAVPPELERARGAGADP